MVRYSVRIKLTDFIETDLENEVLTTIHSISQSTGKKVFLKLWHLEGEISKERLTKFIERHEQLLESIGTNIHMGEHESWTQKSWFNIRKRGTSTDMEYRHEYFYTDASGILDGLGVFYTLLSKMDDVQVVAPFHAPKKDVRHNGYRVTVKRISDVQ